MDRLAGALRHRSYSRISRSFTAVHAVMQGVAHRRVWRLERPGSVHNLVLTTEPIPDVTPGHATVRVEAIGLNFADIFCCLGLYSAAPKTSYIPGLEFAGVVTGIGPSDAAPGLQVGARVWGVARFGAFATQVVLDVRYLRPIPDGWTFQQAAAYPVQTITAGYALLELGALKRNSTVLVQSAAGGVGLQALNILQGFDAKVVGVVSSSEKADLLQRTFGNAMQLECVVRTNPNDFKQKISAALGRLQDDGFDVVLDGVAGPFFQPAFDALKPCGRHVVYGAATLTPATSANFTRGLGLLSPKNILAVAQLLWRFAMRPKLDPMRLPGENKSVMGFNLIWLYSVHSLFDELVQKLEDMRLPPPVVGSTYDFEQLPAAVAALQGGQTVGKVVVCVRHS